MAAPLGIDGGHASDETICAPLAVAIRALGRDHRIALPGTPTNHVEHYFNGVVKPALPGWRV